MPAKPIDRHIVVLSELAERGEPRSLDMDLARARQITVDPTLGKRKGNFLVVSAIFVALLMAGSVVGFRTINGNGNVIQRLLGPDQGTGAWNELSLQGDLSSVGVRIMAPVGADGLVAAGYSAERLVGARSASLASGVWVTDVVKLEGGATVAGSSVSQDGRIVMVVGDGACTRGQPSGVLPRLLVFESDKWRMVGELPTTAGCVDRPLLIFQGDEILLWSGNFAMSYAIEARRWTPLPPLPEVLLNPKPREIALGPAGDLIAAGSSRGRENAANSTRLSRIDAAWSEPVPTQMKAVDSLVSSGGGVFAWDGLSGRLERLVPRGVVSPQSTTLRQSVAVAGGDGWIAAIGGEEVPDAQSYSVGGAASLKASLYSVEKNSWVALADLPEASMTESALIHNKSVVVAVVAGGLHKLLRARIA